MYKRYHESGSNTNVCVCMYVLANLRDSGRAPGTIILRLSLARPASRATHTRAEEGAGGVAGGGVRVIVPHRAGGALSSAALHHL